MKDIEAWESLTKGVGAVITLRRFSIPLVEGNSMNRIKTFLLGMVLFWMVVLPVHEPSVLANNHLYPSDIKGTGEDGASLLDQKVKTYIPYSLNPGFSDVEGGNLVIETAVHDVRFCDGQKRTDAWGGISRDIPTPLRKERNGVEFYEDTLLLSGIGFHGEQNSLSHNPYCHYVFGPIDHNGNDQSWNIFSPRCLLAYLPVTVMIPKTSWNKRLVVYFHGGGQPTEWCMVYPFQFTFDEVRLLKEGYAVVTCAFDLTPRQQNPNAADGSYWKAFGTSIHNAYMGHNLSLDTNNNERRPGWLYDYNVLIHADATLARNLVNLVKNFLKKRKGDFPTYTYAVAYSYGGKLVSSLNGGLDLASVHIDEHPEMLVNGRTPFTGGNFDINDWTGIQKGTSGPSLIETYGRVFDGFFVESGVIDVPGLCVQAKDPDYPVTTKVIHVSGDYEDPQVSWGSLLETWNVAKTLADAHLSLDRDLNHWTRIYHLKIGGHARYDYFFSERRGLNGGENLYYDRNVLFKADGSYRWFSGGVDGLNCEGRGEQFRWWAENLYHYDYFDFIEKYVKLVNMPGYGPLGAPEHIAAHPRTYAIRAQLFQNLIEWVESDIEPPQSCLDAGIMSNPSSWPGEEVQPGVWKGLPQSPDGCPFEDGTLCPLTDCWYQGFDFPKVVAQEYSTAIQYLNDNNLLDYQPESISSPDVTARLGSFVALLSDFAWRKPYDDNYLEELYGTHAGYVMAVWQAYLALVVERLIDPTLGLAFVEEADQSEVLR